MSTELPPQIRLRSAALSLITLVGGVSLAAIPAATLSISSRLFTIEEQGAIAVAVMVAAFAGQLTFAAVIESRLSSAATERRVTFPLWLAALSVLTAIVVAFNLQNAVVLCIALPILLASLEVGRGVSVAERLDIREMWAAIFVGVGALGGVLAAFAGFTWALMPLVLGIVVATGIRSLPVSHKASRPEPRVMAWVMADVAITGGVYPVLNLVIFTLLGPVASVLFTAISTVSGLLAIPLNFLRLRLLKEHSRLDILVSSAAVCVALIAIAICEVLGVFGFIFDAAWTFEATAVALSIACLWRAASLATTIPFAALRRMGEAKLLTILRAIVALLTAAAALLVLQLNELSAVFVVLLAGELLQAVVYEIARRRRTAHRSLVQQAQH